MGKWQVTSSGAGEVKGLIVGEGNTVIATVSGNSQPPGSFPALWQISQFGEIRFRTEFPQEDGG